MSTNRYLAGGKHVEDQGAGVRSLKQFFRGGTEGAGS